MQVEKLQCPKKIEEILGGFVAPGVSLTVNTVKDSACGTPQVESIEFRRGEEFIILAKNSEYGSIGARVRPTPKTVKKIRVSGNLAGKPVSQVFELGESSYEFENALDDVTRVDFEEEE